MPVRIARVVVLLLFAPLARAAITVDIAYSALGGGAYLYEISVANSGPQDVVIVSLTDGPLGDPLITATLAAPAGYFASYDPGLGFVDLLEDSQLFAPGTLTGGFSFESMAAPRSSFTAFEALSSEGEFFAGPTHVVPLPAALCLAVSGIAVLAGTGRRRHADNSHCGRY